MVAFGIASVVVPAIYYSWQYGLKSNYPVPFQGLVMAYIMRLGMFLCIWFQFPKNWTAPYLSEGGGAEDTSPELEYQYPKY